MALLLPGRIVRGILTAEPPPGVDPALSAIARRINAPSTMPPMQTILDRREIREVVEFLTRFTGEGAAGQGVGGASLPSGSSAPTP